MLWDMLSHTSVARWQREEEPMVAALTVSQRHWVEIAAQHAGDFASRAAQHDLENSFPFENLEARQAAGYTNMPSPA